jgi:hypothetical protein
MKLVEAWYIVHAESSERSLAEKIEIKSRRDWGGLTRDAISCSRSTVKYHLSSMPPRKRPSAAQSISDDESEEDVRPPSFLWFQA